MDGFALHALLLAQSELEHELRLNTTSAEVRASAPTRRAQLAGGLLATDSSRYALAFFNRLHMAIRAEIVATSANSGLAPPPTLPKVHRGLDLQ